MNLYVSMLMYVHSYMYCRYAAGRLADTMQVAESHTFGTMIQPDEHGEHGVYGTYPHTYCAY